MSTNFSIYSKVLILFSINLLLVALAVVLLLRQQLSEELDTVIGGTISKRLEELKGEMSEEVQVLQISTWDQVLADFGNQYGVNLYLFDVDGTQAAGQPVTLPPRVKEKLRTPRPKRPPPPIDDLGSPPRPNRPPPPGGRERTRRPSLPTAPNFLVRSSNPQVYWFGTRLSLKPGERRPGVILARASGLFGSGLLIDLKPWFLLAGGVFALSALLWFPLVRDLTKSVKQMTHAAEQIADGDFDVLVNDRRHDELGRLGSAINQMTQRLSGFVTGQKRFLGDSAHELCAPIARMQLALGILEQRADEKSQDYVRDVHEELQHMSGLVNELLSLSKAGLAESTIELQPVELRSLVQNITERDAKGMVPVEICVPETEIVLAEPDLLGRALSNIIRNSIRYGGPKNQITISSESDTESVILSVEDTGPGVPPEDLPKIFDPFYRVDKARTPGKGGTGLGLAIVNTCVTACGGSITVENVSPHGLKLNLTIPRPSEHLAQDV